MYNDKHTKAGRSGRSLWRAVRDRVRRKEKRGEKRTGKEGRWGENRGGGKEVEGRGREGRREQLANIGGKGPLSSTWRS